MRAEFGSWIITHRIRANFLGSDRIAYSRKRYNSIRKYIGALKVTPIFTVHFLVLKKSLSKFAILSRSRNMLDKGIMHEQKKRLSPRSDLTFATFPTSLCSHCSLTLQNDCFLECVKKLVFNSHQSAFIVHVPRTKYRCTDNMFTVYGKCRGICQSYTVKKGKPFSRPQSGCHWSNSSWAGII